MPARLGPRPVAAAPQAGVPVEIGRSEEGRRLVAWSFGRSDARLRVLVVAGQHGDEGWMRQAATDLAAALAAGTERLDPGTALTVVPDLNPDGATRRTRRNARGIDLNRDHQRLESAEVRALHALVAAWRPHLVVDAHNYPPRRRRLLATGCVLATDVFVDVATHPAVIEPIGGRRLGSLLADLGAEMRSRGLTCERYVLVRRSGRVRHSTTDVVDARNGLALRYGAVTVLVEGRAPRRSEAPATAVATTRQREALRGVLAWAGRHAGALIAAAEGAPPAGPVPVWFRHRRAEAPLRLPCLDPENGRPREVCFPRYTPEVRITHAVALPPAYAVPRDSLAALGVLFRHGFEARLPPAGPVGVERYAVRSARPSTRPGRPARHVALEETAEERTLEGYLVFPTDQPGGRALAVLLEPRSKHGLARHQDLGLAVRPAADYPVLRLRA